MCLWLCRFVALSPVSVFGCVRARAGHCTDVAGLLATAHGGRVTKPSEARCGLCNASQYKNGTDPLIDDQLVLQKWGYLAGG